MSRFRRGTSALRTGLTRAERKSGPVTLFRPNARGILRPVKTLLNTLTRLGKK